MKLLLCVAIFDIVTVIPEAFGQTNVDGDYESKLHTEILAKLPKDVQSRPIQSSTNVTDVSIFTMMSHIFGLNERTETLTVSGWMIYRWKDERVKWDPAKFGGLKKIRMASNSLWKPALFLYNSASFTNRNEMFGSVPIIVNKNGNINWYPTYTSQSICSMDLRWFPFDKHECYLEFGGWIYSGQEVNFTVREYRKEAFLTGFSDVHNEWELLKLFAERHALQTYNDWHTIRFNIHLARRATYYHYLFILPILMGIFLCLVIFWLPVSFKFITGSFNIFFLTLFIAHIYWVVPRSGSSTPNIVIITGNTLALAGVSMLFSVITVSLSHRTKPDLPEIIPNYLSGCLGVILCMRPPPVIPTVIAQVVGPNSDSVQMQVTNQSTKRPLKSVHVWAQLATALDRIFFIIYCFTFFIIFMVTFTN